MVEFLTLFLGLVIGPHPVEVMVGSSVESVELRLDGNSVALIEGPPWRAVVDFGPELVPHELEAFAVGTGGGTRHRSVQEINRPRPEAEAALLLERDAEGVPVAARVTWQTNVELRPILWTVTLDGELLPIVDIERFVLPHDATSEFHILQVDLEFAGGITARDQVVYGGEHVGESKRELTAVPVVFEGGKRQPRAGDLDRWFEARGTSLAAVAVERGPAELFLVRAAGVGVVARALAAGSGGMGSSAVSSATGEISLGSANVGATATSRERNRTALSLPEGDSLRVMLPLSTTRQYKYVAHRAFVTAPPITRREGGLLWALTQEFDLRNIPKTSRVADAVAVAGVRAAWGNRRRVVILALSADTPDLSLLSPQAVRGYLRGLDVPLFVWYFEPPADDPTLAGPSARLREDALLAGWPEASRIESMSDLRRAVKQLERELERQRIVWLDGDWPVESIELSEQARASRVGHQD